MKGSKDMLMDRQQAAEYTGMPDDKFKSQIKSGVGPTYLKISSHVVLFRREDLDAWMATWRVVTPKAATA